MGSQGGRHDPRRQAVVVPSVEPDIEHQQYRSAIGRDNRRAGRRPQRGGDGGYKCPAVRTYSRMNPSCELSGASGCQWMSGPEVWRS